MSDFNANASEPTIIPFCNLFKLKNFVKEPARYKNPENSRCINLFLILFLTVSRSFHNTCVFETGLSDFHKLVLTILRQKFESLPSKIIRCRT